MDGEEFVLDGSVDGEEFVLNGSFDDDGEQFVHGGSVDSPEMLEAEAGQVGNDDAASNLHMLIIFKAIIVKMIIIVQILVQQRCQHKVGEDDTVKTTW